MRQFDGRGDTHQNTTNTSKENEIGNRLKDSLDEAVKQKVAQNLLLQSKRQDEEDMREATTALEELASIDTDEEISLVSIDDNFEDEPTVPTPESHPEMFEGRKLRMPPRSELSVWIHNLDYRLALYDKEKYIKSAYAWQQIMWMENFMWWVVNSFGSQAKDALLTEEYADIARAYEHREWLS